MATEAEIIENFPRNDDDEIDLPTSPADKALILEHFRDTYDGAPRERGGPGYTIDAWCAYHGYSPAVSDWIWRTP